MSKMIQVRNVPDRLHKELVRRAKLRHQTLSDYVQSLLEDEVALPPDEEVFERIRSREPVNLPRPVAEYIHEAREERESHLADLHRSSSTPRRSSNTSSDPN